MKDGSGSYYLQDPCPPHPGLEHAKKGNQFYIPIYSFQILTAQEKNEHCPMVGLEQGICSIPWLRVAHR